MPTIELVKECAIKPSHRVRQLASMFDAPIEKKQVLELRGDLPLDEKPWNVGLIVGASGTGKSQILKHVFGTQPNMNWDAPSVIDAFDDRFSINDISSALSSVGFNTVPAWMRPFGILSNGEQFRAEMARRILELPSPIIVDEFTSVVHRQVAQIASHAVAKYVRKMNKQFIAATCHDDVIEWLQPDWVLELPAVRFQWRYLQRRPQISIEVCKVNRSTWQLFAPYHYMSRSVARNSHFFAAYVDEQPAAICAINKFPHPTARDIWACGRLVTMPDYQGLGIAFALSEYVGGCVRAVDQRYRNYPAHPAFIRSYDRNPRWKMIQPPGQITAKGNTTSLITWNVGSRPCAVFEYVGPKHDNREEASVFLGITRSDK